MYLDESGREETPAAENQLQCCPQALTHYCLLSKNQHIKFSLHICFHFKGCISDSCSVTSDLSSETVRNLRGQ